MSLHRTAQVVALLWLGSLVIAAPAVAETRLPVVELFTSQGCSSCPPADALLGELARRGDVIALGFHIDYWDKLGWKDPLSTPQSTERQRRYARLFGTPIYTPQLVVDGAREMVGSQRETVLAALRETMPAAVAPIAFAADRNAVTIGAATAAASDAGGQVWLVRFAQKRRTQIGAGENARRTLDDTNGVESVAPLGEWRGSGATFPLEPPAPGEGIAVLVQAAAGHILGAAILLGS